MATAQDPSDIDWDQRLHHVHMNEMYNATLWYGDLVLLGENPKDLDPLLENREPVIGKVLFSVLQECATLVERLFKLGLGSALYHDGDTFLLGIEIESREIGASQIYDEFIEGLLREIVHAIEAIGAVEPLRKVLRSFAQELNIFRQKLYLALTKNHNLVLMDDHLFVMRGVSHICRVSSSLTAAAKIESACGDVCYVRDHLDSETPGVAYLLGPGLATFEGVAGDIPSVLLGLLPAIGELHIVEVGTRHGDLAEELLKNNHVHLGIVDLWDQTPQQYQEAFGKTLGPMGSFESVIARLSKYRPRLAVFPMDSTAAANWIRDDSLDLVFIDADHSYQAVQADLWAYIGKVRVGGILAGHDYSLFFPGVVQAVREMSLATGWQVHLGVDSCWWFHVSNKHRKTSPERNLA